MKGVKLPALLVSAIALAGSISPPAAAEEVTYTVWSRQDPSGPLRTGNVEKAAERLNAGLTLDVPGLDRCERAVAILEQDPVRPIAQVAAEVGVSHGHLDREFTRIVGLGPRRLARLLRVERLLESIDVTADIPWATLAADLAWADQSHMIRDFKRHTGSSPSQYLAARRSFAVPDSPEDARFVPEST